MTRTAIKNLEKRVEKIEPRPAVESNGRFQRYLVEMLEWDWPAALKAELEAWIRGNRLVVEAWAEKHQEAVYPGGAVIDVLPEPLKLKTMDFLWSKTQAAKVSQLAKQYGKK